MVVTVASMNDLTKKIATKIPNQNDHFDENARGYNGHALKIKKENTVNYNR